MRLAMQWKAGRGIYVKRFLARPVGVKNCIGGKNYPVSIAAKALQCYRNRIFFAGF